MSSGQGVTDADFERDIFGSEPKIPESFAHYRISNLIGRGRSAVVYEAEDRRSGRVVALKVLTGGALESAEERERFRREAEGAARLEHPHIVRAHDFGEDQGVPFFAMELVSGVPLDVAIEENLVTPDQGVVLVEKVARALEHAHEQGVIHRDLKPANIVVGTDGQPRVTDFGLAKHRASSSGRAPAALTEIGVQVGTPCYMAPEQAAGRSRDVDARTDVYAAGCLLYELVAGRRPFDGRSAAEIASKQIRERPLPPRKVRPEIDADLEAVILKCLEKDPRKRYASAGELAEDLRRCLQGRPVSARAARPRRSPVGLRSLAAVLGALAAVSGVTAALQGSWPFATAAAGVLLACAFCLAAGVCRKG